MTAAAVRMVVRESRGALWEAVFILKQQQTLSFVWAVALLPEAF